MPYNHPPGCTSDGYFAAPVTFAGVSMRVVLAPTTSGFAGQLSIANHLDCLRDRHAGCAKHGREHAMLRATPADVAGTRHAHFVGGRMWIAFQKRGRCHNK